jgi:hypothetical protein
MLPLLRPVRCEDQKIRLAYRVCEIRDAFFALLALLRVLFYDVAPKFFF